MVIYQQCRKGEEELVAEKYKNLSVTVVVKSFFDNMPELYEKASVIVSRSGASSVYEIAVAGVPSILVPLPTSADNHQYFNATEFTEGGGGIVIEQKDFSAKLLIFSSSSVILLSTLFCSDCPLSAPTDEKRTVFSFVISFIKFSFHSLKCNRDKLD